MKERPSVRGALLAVAGILAGLALAAIPMPQSATAAGRLIEAAPAELSLCAPAPGETERWRMSVKNLTERELPLALTVDGGSSRLFGGTHPLQLEIRHPRTGHVLYSGDAGDAIGGSLQLPELAGRASLELAGSVTLPRDAGNEYQDGSAQLGFEFLAIDEGQAQPANLPVTGNDLTPWLQLGGIAVALGGGVWALGRMLRSRATGTEEESC